MQPPKLMFIAGEASGDDHGARVISEIRRLCPQAEMFGMGGRMMREAGMRLDEDLAAKLAIMGFVQVFVHLPEVLRMMKRATDLLRTERPDALILIDYPGFNLRLAKRAAKMGIPVIYYISPQLWAWNYRRIETVRRCVKKMLVIFPFERDMYEREGIPVEYVGHPLMDEHEADAVDTAELRTQLLGEGATETTRLVGLVPGSRRKEVQRLMPMMIEAARHIRAQVPDVRFVVPRARTIAPRLLEPLLKEAGDLPITVTEENPRAVYGALDFALCKSGTSTLEMALADTPMVIVYKVSVANELIVKTLIRTKWVGLVNIVAQRDVAPELLGSKCTADTMTHAALEFLQSDERMERARADLREVREKIGGAGCARNTAMAILKTVRSEELGSKLSNAVNFWQDIFH